MIGAPISPCEQNRSGGRQSARLGVCEGQEQQQDCDNRTPPSVARTSQQLRDSAGKASLAKSAGRSSWLRTSNEERGTRNTSSSAFSTAFTSSFLSITHTFTDPAGKASLA
eukprot:scpid39686/ scgid24116/ 